MKRTFLVLAALAVVLGIAACGGGGSSASAPPAAQSDASYENNLLQALRQRYPLPVLTDSSDLKNQINYAVVQSDPNKIEYLEFLSMTGAPIGHFTIKGQVSAESTRITAPTKDKCYEGSDTGEFSCVQDQQPDLTGDYFSQSGGGYFAYLTTGALIQWPASLPFIMSDQPFKTTGPVQLNINENAPISATHPNVHYQKNTPAKTGASK